MLPPIPNSIALRATLVELNRAIKLRADLNYIEKGDGNFLDPFIDNLKKVILEYETKSQQSQ